MCTATGLNKSVSSVDFLLEKEKLGMPCRQLTVIYLVPKLYIEGGPEIFAKGGSDVRLKCSVRGSQEDDWDIAW